MDRNEYRDEDDDVNAAPDTYWRRRAITLALGLGLLGILAWGFSGGGAKNTANSTPTLPATALGTAVPGAPAVGPDSGSPSAADRSTTVKAGASPSGTASPGKGAAPSGTASTSASPAASGHPHQQPGASASPTPGGVPSGGVPSGGCAPGSVVLSLFTDRPSYGLQLYPRFSVYAVSTSSDNCTFNPSQLQVVVLSADRIIWDSTDCARVVGRVAHGAVLVRGVPVQSEVTWNRSITLPGCQLLASSAHAGSYSVQARTATVQSPIRYFKLTG